MFGFDLVVGGNYEQTSDRGMFRSERGEIFIYIPQNFCPETALCAEKPEFTGEKSRAASRLLAAPMPKNTRDGNISQKDLRTSLMSVVSTVIP